MWRSGLDYYPHSQWLTFIGITVMDNSAQRLHYMDNLRAIVMVIGVFFHSALAYSPFLHPIWLSADPVTSSYIDYPINFLHIFRMPLFFVVAGFFAALLIERRGVGAMLKNRSLRVLLPFVIFWPLVILGIIIPVNWALENVQHLSPLLQFIAWTKTSPDAPPRPPGTAHLWFLYYLIFFYVLTVLCRLGMGRLLMLQALKTKLLSMHPLAAILLLPLMLVPGLSLGLVPYPAPDSFIPQLWALGFFGLFFAYGYMIYSSMRMIDYFHRLWPILLLASLLLFVRFQILLPAEITLEYQNPHWPVRIQLILCLAYIAVFMSVVGLACAKHLLNERNIFMHYMSDASYWIYIVHVPIIFMIQYTLMDQPWGVLYKYSISAFGTLLICVLTYFLLVRWTPIGWLLNGRRNKIRV